MVPGGVGARRAARERALGLLYEADAKAARPSAVVAELPAAPDPFAAALVAGVDEHAERIDEILSRHAIGWALDRMPVVDRTVLRLATFELLGRSDIPTGVVISEAVELAKQYSTDESGRFVNGVLSAVSAELRPGEQRGPSEGGPGGESPSP